MEKKKYRAACKLVTAVAESLRAFSEATCMEVGQQCLRTGRGQHSRKKQLNRKELLSRCSRTRHQGHGGRRRSSRGAAKKHESTLEYQVKEAQKHLIRTEFELVQYRRGSAATCKDADGSFTRAASNISWGLPPTQLRDNSYREYLLSHDLASIIDDGCLLNNDDRSSDTSQLSTKKVRDIIIAPNMQPPII